MARGDSSGLAMLYDRFAPIMLVTAFKILRESRSAEDLVHDVFLEAWRQAHTYNGERGTVRTWLLVRLRSRAIDRCRARALRPTTHILPERIDESQGDDELPDHRVVRETLAKLPNEQRQVLEYTYYSGLSASEIAGQLKIPVGTVKSRLGAAIRKLRSALDTGSKECE